MLPSDLPRCPVPCPRLADWSPLCHRPRVALWGELPRQTPLGMRPKVPLCPAPSPGQVFVLHPALGAWWAAPSAALAFAGAGGSWELLICAILPREGSAGLGTRERGCRQLPFPGSLSSSVPGPQPPCLHPCLLMGPIGPRQEGWQVPLIALSPAGQPQTLSEDVVTALNYNVCCFSLPIIDI